LVVAKDHPFAGRKYVEPGELESQTLITYPVEIERLDVYSQFLLPAGCVPKRQRTIETTDIMLQMVASGRGVAALPGWLVAEYRKNREHRSVVLRASDDPQADMRDVIRAVQDRGLPNQLVRPCAYKRKLAHDAPQRRTHRDQLRTALGHVRNMGTKCSVGGSHAREWCAMQSIPTQPIGSIPRSPSLIDAAREFAIGRLSRSALDALYDEAIRETIERLEATGSPVITDGEQRKYHNFATYSVDGATNLAADGFKLHFAAGHYRQWPRLTAGPFRYERYADGYLQFAQRYAHVPVKQALISPSAVSQFYPAEEIPGYPRELFIEDLLREHETEVRRCLKAGAHTVQIDFTEGRLAMKLDPSAKLLNSFIHLNNLALTRFSDEERLRIGIHTCPGGDRDSTHSADVDYADLLPSLFELEAGAFFIALAGEANRSRVLKMIRRYLKPHQRAFVGVIDPLNPQVESEQEVRDRVLEAAEFIPIPQLGTTDDCGFAPFSDDTSTTREVAFEKIRARVAGTALAARALGLPRHG
jgi:5-methyltetrahydropteroyltriglutamate--homocysteine methyltransferase